MSEWTGEDEENCGDGESWHAEPDPPKVHRLSCAASCVCVLQRDYSSRSIATLVEAEKSEHSKNGWKV